MFGHVIPEQQHEGLQEGAEVVVVIDGRVLVEINVTKHLHTHTYTHVHIYTPTHTHSQVHDISESCHVNGIGK